MRRRTPLIEGLFVVAASAVLVFTGGVAGALPGLNTASAPISCSSGPVAGHSGPVAGSSGPVASSSSPVASHSAPISCYKVAVSSNAPDKAKAGSKVVVKAKFTNKGLPARYSLRSELISPKGEVIDRAQFATRLSANECETQTLSHKVSTKGTYKVVQSVFLDGKLITQAQTSAIVVK